MILEVKQFPESQEVMDDPEWFFIMDTNSNDNKLGNSSYARILDESEYILVEKTTADEHNKEWNKVINATDGYGFDGINQDVYEILEETLFEIRKEK